VDCLAHDLTLVDLKSRGFLSFREYLTNYVESVRFKSLLGETKKLKADLAEVKYCLVIKGDRVTIRHCESEIDYSADVEKTFERFKQGAVKDYKVKFSGGPDMNHIEARVLDFGHILTS
jgi:hypothetical protein